VKPVHLQNQNLPEIRTFMRLFTTQKTTLEDGDPTVIPLGVGVKSAKKADVALFLSKHFGDD